MPPFSSCFSSCHVSYHAPFPPFQEEGGPILTCPRGKDLPSFSLLCSCRRWRGTPACLPYHLPARTAPCLPPCSQLAAPFIPGGVLPLAAFLPLNTPYLYCAYPFFKLPHPRPSELHIPPPFLAFLLIGYLPPHKPSLPSTSFPSRDPIFHPTTTSSVLTRFSPPLPSTLPSFTTPWDWMVVVPVSCQQCVPPFLLFIATTHPFLPVPFLRLGEFIYFCQLSFQGLVLLVICSILVLCATGGHPVSCPYFPIPLPSCLSMCVWTSSAFLLPSLYLFLPVMWFYLPSPSLPFPHVPHPTHPHLVPAPIYTHPFVHTPPSCLCCTQEMLPWEFLYLPVEEFSCLQNLPTTPPSWFSPHFFLLLMPVSSAHYYLDYTTGLFGQH